MENNENFDLSKIDEIQKSIEMSQKSIENNENVQALEEQEIQSNVQEDITEEIPDLAHWEEYSRENSAVKKYITYISKDFIELMDEMSADERSAYINDAIQKKLDLENEQLQLEKKKATITHIILVVVTLIISMPFMLIGVNKAIMHTFDNYKYSQDNFEKLYKHRFEKEKAQIRTLQHNMLNKDSKNKK